MIGFSGGDEGVSIGDGTTSCLVKALRDETCPAATTWVRAERPMSSRGKREDKLLL